MRDRVGVLEDAAAQLLGSRRLGWRGPPRQSPDLGSIGELQSEPVPLDQSLDVGGVRAARQRDPRRCRRDRTSAAGPIRATAGLSRIGSSQNPGSSPSGSLTQNIRSGAPSVEAPELRNVAIEWRIGPVVAGPRQPESRSTAGWSARLAPDAGKVDPDLDAQAREVLGRPDARTHEDRRAAVRAGREDDPVGPDLGAVDELHPGRPARSTTTRATSESARTARLDGRRSGAGTRRAS